MGNYCDGGMHFIGDSSECYRCQIVQRRRTKEKLFYSHLDTIQLKNWLQISE